MPSPNVHCETIIPGLPVSDVMTAIDFYTNKLGFTPGFTWGDPIDMAGMNLGKVEVHLFKNTPQPEVCSVYFIVDNADELFAFQQANG